jgi:hypothetical protein
LGAASRFDSGWLSLLAFPRAYLVLGMWAAIMWKIRPKVPWPAVAAIAVVGVIASSLAMQRWRADEVDGAVMAVPEQHGYIEVEPQVTPSGIEFKSMIASGWDLRSIPIEGGPPAERRWTLYSSFERGNWDVAVRDIRTGETRILTSSQANDLMPVLSPNGKEIFFASDRRRGYRFTAIHRMSLP